MKMYLIVTSLIEEDGTSTIVIKKPVCFMKEDAFKICQGTHGACVMEFEETEFFTGQEVEEWLEERDRQNRE